MRAAANENLIIPAKAGLACPLKKDDAVEYLARVSIIFAIPAKAIILSSLDW